WGFTKLLYLSFVKKNVVCNFKPINMKKIILLMYLVSSMLANAQTADKELQKAEDFFKTANVITYNEDYDPYDYVGSLIYFKKEKPNEFKVFKLISSDIKGITRIEKGEIIYQKMHTKEDVSQAKFLGIFNSKVSNKNLLEVVLTKNYSLESPNVFDNLDLYTRINSISKVLIAQGYTVEYVWKVNVNQLTSRLFKEGNIQAGLNYQVQGDTKIYNQTEDFMRKSLFTLQTFDASILIPKVAEDINKLLTNKNNKSMSLDGFDKIIHPETKTDPKTSGYKIADK